MMQRTGRSIVCSVLAALLILTFSMPALAAQDSMSRAADDTKTINGIKYSFSTQNGTEIATVTGYDEKTVTNGVLTIPSTADGKSVVAIGEGAFKSSAALKSVTLPNTVTDIGKSAFESCKELTSVTGGALTSISDSAFASCSKLETVPDLSALTIIPKRAFADDYLLTGIDLTSVQEIQLEGLARCRSLGALETPALVTIGESAFSGASGLTSINWATVTTISKTAFFGCSALTTADLTNVNDIPQSAFANCTSLQTVTWPTGDVTIGQRAFAGCTSLSSADLSGRTSLNVGAEAFYGCTKLSTITLPKELTLGAYAFTNTPADPKAQGTMNQTVQITYEGTLNEWNKIAGSNYTGYKIKTTDGSSVWNPGIQPTATPSGPGVTTPDPGAPAPDWSPDPLPAPDSSWAKISTTSPKSGDEVTLTTTAAQGLISYRMVVERTGNAICDIKPVKDVILLDSSKNGIGHGLRTYEVTGPVYGRPGDTIQITLEGTYTYEGSNYPLSIDLPTIRIQDALTIEAIDQNGLVIDPKNVELNEEITLSAKWGSPPIDKHHTWTCDPSDVYLVANNPDGTATFRASEPGRYRVTCSGTGTGTGELGEEVKSTQTVELIVSGHDVANGDVTIEGTQTKNMQPGDTATLKVSWNEGRPSFGTIRYQWTSYPDSSALPGSTTSSSVTFAPQQAGTYNVSCTITVSYPADPTRGYTIVVSADPIEVQKYALTLTSSPDTTPVKPGDSLTLTAAWSPDPSGATGIEPIYSWTCTSGGSSKQDLLSGIVPSSSTATFTPRVAGSYVVRCTSTYRNDEGRTLTVRNTLRFEVGATLEISGVPQTQIAPGTAVNLSAAVKPDGMQVDLSNAVWSCSSRTLQGADGSMATRVTGQTANFQTDKAGTYTVNCSVSSSAGQIKTSVQITVSEYPMSITLGTQDPKVNVPIDLSVSAQGTLPNLRYAWSFTAGAQYISGTDPTGADCKMIATKSGTYLVTCRAYQLQTDNKGQEKEVQVGMAQLTVQVTRDSTGTAAGDPSLSLRSSVAGNRISTKSSIVITAEWQNGVPDNVGTLQWSIQDNGAATPTFNPLPAPALPNILQLDGASIGEGQYTIRCESGAASAEIDIEVYDSSVLQLTAMTEPETDGVDPDVFLETDVADGKTPIRLTAAWVPELEGSLRISYRWTCDGDVTGNVSAKAFRIVEGDDTQRILDLESIDDAYSPVTDANSKYTITCTASGVGLPKETRAKTATFVVTLNKTGTISIAPAQVPVNSVMSASLVPNAPVVMTASALTGEQRMSGLTAAGTGHEGWTVQHIVSSFGDDAHSVVVLDRNGTPRENAEDRIVTGDRVQLLDADSTPIDEATIVLMGDLLGTGELNLSQLVVMAKGMKDSTVLTGPYMEAGDWDGSSSINLSDLVQQASELKNVTSQAV